MQQDTCHLYRPIDRLTIPAKKDIKVWDGCSFFYFVINPSTAVLYGQPSTGHRRLY
eukprot:SAG25_NODE_14802_length_246_cov_2.727891_1_plen_55_part_01